MTGLMAGLSRGLSEDMRVRANAMARNGEIAIVGRAVPWNEYSMSHQERVMPGAFGFPTVPPPLISEHSSKTSDGGLPLIIGEGLFVDNTTESRSLDGYGTGGGFDCLWLLAKNTLAVDWLYRHIDQQNLGLSVEMRVFDEEHVREGWKHPWVRHVKQAVATAVAIVERPSYWTAGIHGIVTPETGWFRHHDGGGLVPAVEPLTAANMRAMRAHDYERAYERAEAWEARFANPDGTRPDPIIVQADYQGVRAAAAEVEARTSALAMGGSLPPIEYRAADDETIRPVVVIPRGQTPPDPAVSAIRDRAQHVGTHDPSTDGVAVSSYQLDFPREGTS